MYTHAYMHSARTQEMHARANTWAYTSPHTNTYICVHIHVHWPRNPINLSRQCRTRTSFHHIYIHTHTHTSVYIYVCTYVHWAHTPINLTNQFESTVSHTFTSFHPLAVLRSCPLFFNIHTYTHTHTHINTRTHARTHTHTHSYT
jgi:hypothetical protein